MLTISRPIASKIFNKLLLQSLMFIILLIANAFLILKKTIQYQLFI